MTQSGNYRVSLFKELWKRLSLFVSIYARIIQINGVKIVVKVRWGDDIGKCRRQKRTFGSHI